MRSMVSSTMGPGMIAASNTIVISLLGGPRNAQLEQHKFFKKASVGDSLVNAVWGQRA